MLNVFFLNYYIFMLIVSLCLVPIADIFLNSRGYLKVFLFFGVLSLINAPFDWLSLGLTRGLLRKGLRMGGLAPVWLGALDVLLSTLIIAALAVAAVIAIQVFNRMAGDEILDVFGLLNGISLEWWRAEYWWVYVMILSTQLPSLVNLAIGATALFRGIPGLQKWCLRHLPEDGRIPAVDRHLLATVFSLQVLGGIIIGSLAYLLIATFIFGCFLPTLRIELITIAEHVAIWVMP